MIGHFQEKLRQLADSGRERRCRTAAGIDLTSNDYLGLRAHPALRAAAIKALTDGLELGAGGSRLLRGHHPAHQALEEFAAAWFGAPSALYFATGYQANLALFSALPDRHDVIIYDALIHASARDGIRASPARSVRVTHNDLAAFAEALQVWRGQAARLWIAVESVYSMDGDRCPLPELAALAARHDAMLIVDEAHATGLFGASGRGLTEGFDHRHVIALHTCGKALGVAGGLVCAAQEVIGWLVNKARPFIYSTAPMPLQAVLVQKALEIIAAEPERRARLWRLHEAARQVLPVPVPASPIIPIPAGEDQAAVALADALQRDGFDIRAIRPPAVPEGTARLRLTLRADLEEATLQDFAAALRRHWRGGADQAKTA